MDSFLRAKQMKIIAALWAVWFQNDFTLYCAYIRNVTTGSRAKKASATPPTKF